MFHASFKFVFTLILFRAFFAVSLILRTILYMFDMPDWLGLVAICTGVVVVGECFSYVLKREDRWELGDFRLNWQPRALVS